ncbi:MAG: hypothetical protein V3R24_02765, partial [Gemmatimonadales bacterium]
PSNWWLHSGSNPPFQANPNVHNWPILLKNSRPPADASKLQEVWRGEAPQIVVRGIKVQSNALSAPLVTGKTA